MKKEYDRKEILLLLESAKPGISTKNSNVEQSDSFIFHNNKIITYNDQISIVVPFESELEGCVPANELHKTLSKIKEDIIILYVEDNQLHIKAKKTKAKLKLIEIENIIIPEIPTEWAQLPKNFIEGISLCIFSASHDEASGFLNCINILENKIISSDNYRISQFSMDEKMNGFLLPVSSANKLINFDIVEYSLSDSWVYFKTIDRAVFCSRIIDVPYPDVSKMLSTVKGIKFKLPDTIKKSIELSSIFAEGEFDTHKRIYVTLKKGEIICKGEKESGTIQTKTDIDFDKEKINFMINPIFFLQIIDKSTTVIYSENVLLFQSGTFQHLLALYNEEA